MNTYIINEHLDYVALVLIERKQSFIYDGINITFKAPKEFIDNLKNQDGLMATIHYYEQKY